MVTNNIDQIIKIKTQGISQKSLLKLRDLITVYRFNFEYISEENSDYLMIFTITLTAEFISIDQMFEFNRELHLILGE